MYISEKILFYILQNFVKVNVLQTMDVQNKQQNYLI